VLEEQREELNNEFQSLTLQADTRARLDLKRAEVKSKMAEIDNQWVSALFLFLLISPPLPTQSQYGIHQQ